MGLNIRRLISSKNSRVKFSWIAHPLFKTTPLIRKLACGLPRKPRKLNPTEISLHTVCGLYGNLFTVNIKKLPSYHSQKVTSIQIHMPFSIILQFCLHYQLLQTVLALKVSWNEVMVMHLKIPHTLMPRYQDYCWFSHSHCPPPPPRPHYHQHCSVCCNYAKLSSQEQEKNHTRLV